MKKKTVEKKKIMGCLWRMYCSEIQDRLFFNIGETPLLLIGIFDDEQKTWMIDVDALKKSMNTFRRVLERLRTTNVLVARITGPFLPVELIQSHCMQHQIIQKYIQNQRDCISLLACLFMQYSNVEIWEPNLFKHITSLLLI